MAPPAGGLVPPRTAEGRRDAGHAGARQRLRREPIALHEAAIDALEGVFCERNWPATRVWQEAGPTGPAALYAVEADPNELKRALIDLETRHTMGRLWDLDVTDPEVGALSRRSLGLPVRRCLLCGEAAHACARSRAHPLAELLGAVERILNGSSSSRSAPRA